MKNFNFKDRERAVSQPSEADDLQGQSQEPAIKRGESEARWSRRRFAGVGLGAPMILTLASRPAFGAVCSPSGFASYTPENPSGIRHASGTCNLSAWSPGAWGRPFAGNGNGDSHGSFDHWVKAGYYPNDPRVDNPNVGGGNVGKAIDKVKSFADGLELGETYLPSVFATVFGRGPSGTLHDMLLPPYAGTLECHATAALLNAAYGHPGYMPPEVVIKLYVAKTTSTPYEHNGTVIDMATFELKDFFDQTWNGA